VADNLDRLRAEQYGYVNRPIAARRTNVGIASVGNALCTRFFLHSAMAVGLYDRTLCSRTESEGDAPLTDQRFAHLTPALYDRCMGPLLFEVYAKLVAERCAWDFFAGLVACAALDWLRKRAGGTVNSRLNARLKAASDS
jgi:hypothetical protein